MNLRFLLFSRLVFINVFMKRRTGVGLRFTVQNKDGKTQSFHPSVRKCGGCRSYRFLPSLKTASTGLRTCQSSFDEISNQIRAKACCNCLPLALICSITLTLFSVLCKSQSFHHPNLRPSSLVLLPTLSRKPHISSFQDLSLLHLRSSTSRCRIRKPHPRAAQGPQARLSLNTYCPLRRIGSTLWRAKCVTPPLPPYPALQAPPKMASRI